VILLFCYSLSHNRNRHAGDPGAGQARAAYGVSEALDGTPPRSQGSEARRVIYDMQPLPSSDLGLAFSGIDSITCGLERGFINGMLAVPIMAMMMMIVANRKLMGRFRARMGDRLGLARHRPEATGGDRVVLVFLTLNSTLLSPRRRRQRYDNARRLFDHPSARARIVPGELDTES